MARATAEAMAPPMLEFAICCMSMMNGKTSEMPASALNPSRPTKCASTVAVTAMSTTFTTTFAGASRSSVEMMGASRRRERALAACGRETLEDCKVVALLVPIGPSCPAGLEQRLDEASFENRAAAGEPDGGSGKRFLAAQQRIVSRGGLKFSHVRGSSHWLSCHAGDTIPAFT